MYDKFRCEDLLKYFSITRMEEIDLNGVTVLHQYRMRGKGWIEFFVFDNDDVSDLDNDALIQLAKTYPRVKTEPDIDATIGRYRYVYFNRLSFYDNLDLFDKTLLQATRGGSVQRICTLGKSGNGDPRFYKDVWWVFHEDSPCQNAAELIDSDMCRFTSEKALREFLEEYQSEDSERPYYVLHKAYYRLGVKVLDYEKMRQKDPDIIFAPALEDDEEV